jgi:hypothetical protein
MFARPGPLREPRSGTEHPIAGSLPAVNLAASSAAANVAIQNPFALALAELEALAGALLPVLLAFLHA